MPRIFISCRRADSGGFTSWIHDQLAKSSLPRLDLTTTNKKTPRISEFITYPAKGGIWYSIVPGSLYTPILPLHELKVYGLSLMSLVVISNVQLLELSRQLVPLVTMK